MKKRTALLLGLSATAAFLLFLFVRTLTFAPAGVTVHPEHRTAEEDLRLDLNLASPEELQLLPGIGPSLSEAIVARREEHGAFRSVDELAEVPGIGEKTLSAVRDYVFVKGGTDEDPGS
ncbi:MAG: helix-hairpin-helix domain-containing protein [Oscillospiraceae bacterium]|nr:helix-hairpin-helix domain-containing protein [Oscillospiraceae bacterium]